MSQRHERKAMKKAKAKQQSDARFFFLSMQAKTYWERRKLARRLMNRTDLKEQAARDQVTLKDLRKQGIVRGRF